jgi:hypothetical protein
MKQESFKECFWSEASAKAAAHRLVAKGYEVRVTYSMDADGRHDWLLTAFYMEG